MILTYIRGVCFNSTYNLNKLAQKNPTRYLNLAQKITRAKQEATRDARYNMDIDKQFDIDKYHALLNKEIRYDTILKKLASIENKVNHPKPY